MIDLPNVTTYCTAFLWAIQILRLHIVIRMLGLEHDAYFISYSTWNRVSIHVLIHIIIFQEEYCHIWYYQLYPCVAFGNTTLVPIAKRIKETFVLTYIHMLQPFCLHLILIWFLNNFSVVLPSKGRVLLSFLTTSRDSMVTINIL